MCNHPPRTATGHAGLARGRRLPPWQAAFTLVELLVVIAIIGLLVAILFPALRKVRDQSVRTECSSIMHQWGVALTAYAAQNRGYFPDNTRGAQVCWVSEEVKAFLSEFMVDMQGWRPDDPGKLGRPDPTCCPAQEWHRYIRERADPGTGTILLGYFYFPHQNLMAAGNLGVADFTPAGNGWVTRTKFGGPDRNAPVMADMIECAKPDTWGQLGYVFSSHVKGSTPTGGNYLFEDGRVEWYPFTPRTEKHPASIEIGAKIGNWLMWYKIPVNR